MKIFVILLLCFFITLAPGKFLPRVLHISLDANNHEPTKSNYDTPSYDHDELEEHTDDLLHGQQDLLVDLQWAIKAKLKELKVFNKALKANLISSKLKIKDFLENHLDVIKNHHHQHQVEYHDRGPIYHHQNPEYSYHHGPYQPEYEQQRYPQNPHYAQRYPPTEQYRLGQHDPYYGQ